MNKKILISLSCLSIVFLTGLSLPSCGNKTNTDTSATSSATSTPSSTVTLNSAPLDTVDATTFDASVTATYDKAEADAKAWKSNAELVMVSVKLPSDLSLNNATQTYTYGSSDETKYWWTYSYAEQTTKYVRALVYREDYLGSTLKAIPKNYWRTNYVEAFQIAQNSGGGADFMANNQNVSVTETLSVSDPKGYLWWLVEYTTPLGNNLSVRINPNDRTIVDETGTIIATGKAYSPDTTYTTNTNTNTTTDTNTTSTTYTAAATN